MPALLNRSCRCRSCRARDAETFARIVARSHSPRELARLANVWTSAQVADLETSYAAPAMAPARGGVTS